MERMWLEIHRRSLNVALDCECPEPLPCEIEVQTQHVHVSLVVLA